MTNNVKRLVAISCAAVMITSMLGACSAAGGTSAAVQASNSCEAWHTDGKTVVFTLRDISASTGYTWNYEISDEEVLKNTGAEVTNAGESAGSSGLAKFTFEGVAAGGTTVIFTQTSPSGNDDGDRLRYEITVADDGTVTVG